MDVFKIWRGRNDAVTNPLNPVKRHTRCGRTMPKPGTPSTTHRTSCLPNGRENFYPKYPCFSPKTVSTLNYTRPSPVCRPGYFFQPSWVLRRLSNVSFVVHKAWKHFFFLIKDHILLNYFDTHHTKKKKNINSILFIVFQQSP